METKFTRGPWSLETVRTSVGVCHKVGPFPAKREGDKPRHACLYADYPSDSNPADRELLANARLIAAAPAMFEELRIQLERQYNPFEPDNQSDSYLRIKALLEFATGEQS